MESIYPKIRKHILQTKQYQNYKEAFLEHMESGPIGICQQRPSGEDCMRIEYGDIRGFLESRSKYAEYVIQLAALDDAAFELKARTGYPGYTDVQYIPVCSMRRLEILKTGKTDMGQPVFCMEYRQPGRTAGEVFRECREKYGMAESYEVETVLEEEINVMLESNMYQKVYIAGKLEFAAELTGAG